MKLNIEQLDMCRYCGIVFHKDKTEELQYDANKRRQKYYCPLCKNDIDDEE